MSGQLPQQNAKASFDPGWNDPPPLSYSPQSLINKPRNILNKRVAFPLTPGSSHSTAAGAAPPLPPAPAPLLAPSIPISANTLTEDLSIDSNSALREVTETLSRILDESTELESSAGDIRKRIAAIEDSWKNKLNVEAQKKMLKLVTALKEGRPREAEDIHKALAVEHAGSVGAWMPAVRKLIHRCIATQELLSIDKEEM